MLRIAPFAQDNWNSALCADRCVELTPMQSEGCRLREQVTVSFRVVQGHSSSHSPSGKSSIPVDSKKIVRNIPEDTLHRRWMEEGAYLLGPLSLKQEDSVSYQPVI